MRKSSVNRAQYERVCLIEEKVLQVTHCLPHVSLTLLSIFLLSFLRHFISSEYLTEFKFRQENSQTKGTHRRIYRVLHFTLSITQMTPEYNRIDTVAFSAFNMEKTKKLVFEDWEQIPHITRCRNLFLIPVLDNLRRIYFTWHKMHDETIKA